MLLSTTDERPADTPRMGFKGPPRAVCRDLYASDSRFVLNGSRGHAARRLRPGFGIKADGARVGGHGDLSC